MAKNAKSAAVKGRETKLAKKSNEELIQIILRKDATERNLQTQVQNLKSEVNTLTTRVENFDKDMEGTNNALEAHKDRVATLMEQKATLQMEVEDTKAEAENKAKKLKGEVTLYKVIGIVAAVAFIVMLLGVILT